MSWRRGGILQFGQVVDRPREPAPAATGRRVTLAARGALVGPGSGPAQRPLGIDDQQVLRIAEEFADEYRAPVLRTTGVLPTGAQVVPE